MKNKVLPEIARKGVIKIFRENMLTSLMEFDDPKAAAQRLLDSLPWALGESDTGEAMNAGIREAAIIILAGGSDHEI